MSSIKNKEVDLKRNAPAQSNNVKGEFKCIFLGCDWTFENNYKLQRHLRSHTGEKPFTCQDCQKSFSNRYNLTSHLLTHAKAQYDSSGCSPLRKKTELKKGVSVAAEHLVATFKCTQKRCRKTFETIEELNEHIENHDCQHKCTFDGCEKSFKKPCLLKLHFSTHNGDMQFQCSYPECGKAFVNQQRLTRHQLIHENKKMFLCDVDGCHSRFNCAEYLKAHKRIHEPSKKFVCPSEHCQNTFACAGTLKVHLQRHGNIRPYKCDHSDCEKAYLTLSNLKAHKKLHLVDRPAKKKVKKDAAIHIKNSKKVSKRKKMGKPQAAISVSNLINDGININDFINVPVLDVALCDNIDALINEVSSREDLIAATFGEFACNQYMSMNITETMPALNNQEDGAAAGILHNCADLSSQNHNDNLNAAHIEDIQFQEEFVSSIYQPVMINNYRDFVSGHDYEQSVMRNDEKTDSVFVPPNVSETNKRGENGARILIGDIDGLLEPSMELSTGHLVIDGGYLGASSCMPDHIYSHQNDDKSKKEFQEN